MDRRTLLATAAAATAGCLGSLRGGESAADPEPPDSGPIVDAGGPIRWVFGPSPDRLYALTESGLVATALSGGRRWSYAPDTRVLYPRAAEETIYALTEPPDCGFCAGGTTVVAIDDETGEPKWTTSPDVSSFNLLAAGEGGVFGGTGDDALGDTGEEVFALDGADGSMRWSVESGDASGGLLDDDTLYVPTAGTLYAYEADTGDERWRADYDAGSWETWLLDDRLVLEDRGLHALRLDDGETLWSFTGEGYETDDSFIVNSVSIDRAAGTAFAGDWDGVLWAVSTASGNVRWHERFDTDGRVSSVRFDDERVYGYRDGAVAAVSRKSRERAWDRSPDVPGEISFVALERVGSTLFALVAAERDDDSSTRLLALDPESGAERWRQGPLPPETATATVGGYLLVALGSRLYAVDGDRRLPADAIDGS